MHLGLAKQLLRTLGGLASQLLMSDLTVSRHPPTHCPQALPRSFLYPVDHKLLFPPAFQALLQITSLASFCLLPMPASHKTALNLHCIRKKYNSSNAGFAIRIRCSQFLYKKNIVYQNIHRIFFAISCSSLCFCKRLMSPDLANFRCCLDMVSQLGSVTIKTRAS